MRRVCAPGRSRSWWFNNVRNVWAGTRRPERASRSRPSRWSRRASRSSSRTGSKRRRRDAPRLHHEPPVLTGAGDPAVADRLRHGAVPDPHQRDEQRRPEARVRAGRPAAAATCDGRLMEGEIGPTSWRVTMSERRRGRGSSPRLPRGSRPSRNVRAQVVRRSPRQSARQLGTKLGATVPRRCCPRRITGSRRHGRGFRTERHDCVADRAEPVELDQLAGAEHGLWGRPGAGFALRRRRYRPPRSGPDRRRRFKPSITRPTARYG